MEETELLSLPEELLVHIGRYLDLPSLLACSATCHFLRSILNNNQLWRKHFRKEVVECVKSAACLVTPEFRYEEHNTLEGMCEERVNLLRQVHLMNNWRTGCYTTHETRMTGNQMVLENNDRQIIYDHEYLFLYILRTDVISVWHIRDDPYLFTSVPFTLYEYNMEDNDWVDMNRLWYQIVKNKLLIVQGNLVQVFSIQFPNKKVALDYLISVDRENSLQDIVDTTFADCYTWIVGDRLFSRLCYLPLVHIWDLNTGTKVKVLHAPTAGWDLYAISTDKEDDIVFSLRTDDPFATGQEDYRNVTNHVSSYSVSQDKYTTTLFSDLRGCKPVHAMHSGDYIILFCIDDMFDFRCSVYVCDLITSDVIARRTFTDLVGIYKSKIIRGELVIGTQSSVNTLDIVSLQTLWTIHIDDVIDIDFFPVFEPTFLISSLSKTEPEVWDIETQQLVLRLPSQSYFFLNQSCTKLILISGQQLIVRHYW